MVNELYLAEAPISLKLKRFFLDWCEH